MKKTVLSFWFCILTVFAAASFCQAAGGGVIEAPHVKMVIDGKEGVYKNVPVIVNDRTLLPLRDLLVNLGVENDEEHIAWDAGEKSVTVTHAVYGGSGSEPVKIFLKIDSRTAYVNNLPVTLDVAPVIYRESAYIPTRFVSQALGKIVIWEESTTSVLIRDEAEFKRIREILGRSDAAVKAADSLTMRAEVETKWNMPGLKLYVESTAKMMSEADHKNKILHNTTQMSLLGRELNSEVYLSNGVWYEKGSAAGRWKKKTLKKEQYAALYDEYGNFAASRFDDVLCAGLLESNAANPDELVLKGDAYLTALFNQANIFPDSIQKFEFGKGAIEIVLDKKTLRLERVSMETAGSAWIGNEKAGLSVKITIAYADYNAKQEIKIPEEVKTGATEE